MARHGNAANRPELTKRPFLSHKRTKGERAWPLFQRNQAFKGHGITKGELALGDPCKRPGKSHRVDFLQLVHRAVLSLSPYVSNPRVSLVLAILVITVVMRRRRIDCASSR